MRHACRESTSVHAGSKRAAFIGSCADVVLAEALLKALVLPPTGPLLVAIFGLASRRRAPGRPRRLHVAGVLSLLLLSFPSCRDLSAGTVRRQRSPPLDLGRRKSAQAIVILGGGTRRDAPEYGGDTLGPLDARARALRRARRAAHRPAGPRDGRLGLRRRSRSQADAANRSRAEFGVRCAGPRPVAQHARERGPLRRDPAGGRHRVGRARGARFRHARAPRAEFAAAGIETIPAPTGIRRKRRRAWLDYVPSIGALQGSYYAIYEIFGNMARAITAGR